MTVDEVLGSFLILARCFFFTGKVFSTAFLRNSCHTCENTFADVFVHC